MLMHRDLRSLLIFVYPDWHKKAGLTLSFVLPSFSEFCQLLVESVLCPSKIHHLAEKSNSDDQPYQTI